jgi:predicted metal-dependent peptidase
MTPMDLMIRARGMLYQLEPFYGTLTMHLELLEDPKCKTAWTDGVTIGFNPDFISNLDDYGRMFVFKHEVWHPVNGDHVRRGDRDSKDWNTATDRRHHSYFKDVEGMVLIPNVHYDPSDRNKSAEMIYDIIQIKKAQQPQPQQGQEQQQGQGKGAGDGDGNIGEVRDFPGSGEDGKPTSSEVAQEEGKWCQALERAIKEGEKYGSVPGFARTLLEAKKRPKVSWKEVLRRFAEECLDSTDYNWMKANPKYTAFYIPSLDKNQDQIKNLVFAIDTSGSMLLPWLEQSVDELSNILESYNVMIYVLLIDTEVHKVLEFSSDDLPLKFEAIGCGGTSFVPAFKWVEENDVEPSCLIYYTDGMGRFPSNEPNYPVLWIGTLPFNPPFGEYIGIK